VEQVIEALVIEDIDIANRLAAAFGLGEHNAGHTSSFGTGEWPV